MQTHHILTWFSHCLKQFTTKPFIAYALARPLRGLAGRLELGSFRGCLLGVVWVAFGTFELPPPTFHL